MYRPLSVYRRSGGVHLPFLPANIVGGGQPALSYDCHYLRNPFYRLVLLINRPRRPEGRVDLGAQSVAAAEIRTRDLAIASQALQASPGLSRPENIFIS